MNQYNQTSPMKKSRWLIAAVIIGVVIWGLRWMSYARQPLTVAIDALENDETVRVSFDPWLTFSPEQVDPNTGFIFYPGGRIDPRGYASLMRAITREGYLVVVPDMPLNIAAFRPNIADKIMKGHPDIKQWVIGGHSVGGAMAAQYTSTHSEIIDGLVIWASYPPDAADLSGFIGPVVLIYGSRETRVTDSSVAERQHLLPSDTVYVRIEGADHHQFGAYEINPKDHLASISQADQHKQIIQPTLNLLVAVSRTD